jgi:hypothetical protein
MQGVLDNGGSLEETVLKAFLAGCDILLLGGKQLLGHQTGFELTADDVIKIHRFLVSKVRGGEISKERLDESVQRILDLKKGKECGSGLPKIRPIVMPQEVSWKSPEQIRMRAGSHKDYFHAGLIVNQ